MSIELLYDTNAFSDAITRDETIKFSICCVSLYEMMKNKDYEKRIECIKRIKSFCQKNNIDIICTNNCPIIFSMPIKQLYSIIMQQAKRFYEKAIDNYLKIIVFLITVMVLEKNRTRDIKAESKSIESILLRHQQVEKEFFEVCKDDLVRDVLNNKKKDIDQLFSDILNYMVKKTNDAIDLSFNLNNRSLSFLDLFGKNGIKVTEEITNSYLDIFSFRDNPTPTKQVYKFYINYLLQKGCKIEFNDLADMEIAWCAYSNGMRLKSNDEKINELYNELKK